MLLTPAQVNWAPRSLASPNGGGLLGVNGPRGRGDKLPLLEACESPNV